MIDLGYECSSVEICVICDVPFTFQTLWGAAYLLHKGQPISQFNTQCNTVGYLLIWTTLWGKNE